MTTLAYIDVRPFLFLVGLPLFIGLALLIGRFAWRKAPKRTVAFFSTLLYTALFTLFLTGFGPFIDQEETREYLMTWELNEGGSDEKRETEVVLSFVDFPGYYIGEYSDDLAIHLREQANREVKVLFEVTSDYGKVRGFNATEIGGLREWKSEWGYAGTKGSPEESPWD
ncbi:MAG: hypothetical protein P1U85_02935 [Verrucomicrobiales bacterium]|jgi:hypothetical protein|nr:hypothetical protein [Verrucomicrobiales bacterium]